MKTQTEEELREEDFQNYKKLRDQGHAIYCAINIVLANEECNCKNRENEKANK